MNNKRGPTYARRAALAAAACLTLVGSNALAQSSGSVTIDADECTKIESRDERLACFERQVDAARRADGGAAAEAPAAEGSRGGARRGAEPREQAVESREPEPRVEPRERAAEPDRAADNERSRRRSGRGGASEGSATDIVAKVAGLRETLPNTYLITLDNGQVWRQMRPMPYPLRVGDEVRLAATSWGDARRLTDPDLKGYIQVERVR